jgi:hypothetical protein
MHIQDPRSYKGIESKATIFLKVNNFEDSSNQALFDPSGLFHVGQSERPEGNCYQYHLSINETPCTPDKIVQQNEKMREQKWKENCKERKLSKITKKEQEHKDRWDREQENFEKWKGIY